MSGMHAAASHSLRSHGNPFSCRRFVRIPTQKSRPTGGFFRSEIRFGGIEWRTPAGVYRRAMTLASATAFLFCCLEHIFDKDAVTAARIINENMRHRANELAILEDRAAAHPLYDTARLLQQ